MIIFQSPFTQRDKIRYSSFKSKVCINTLIFKFKQFTMFHLLLTSHLDDMTIDIILFLNFNYLSTREYLERVLLEASRHYIMIYY